jgi:DNA-directed RNA polymerase specialized sigma24 family protein
MLEAALVTASVSDERSDSFGDSFIRVVRERETQVLRTALRILGNWADAEDVAQEVFLKLHRHGLRFASEAALGAWIYRVTVNLCIDRSRTAKPRGEMPYATGGFGGGPTQYSYMDVGLTTSGDFVEGQKTVLGKVSGTDDETSIFVVISLKVLD